MTVAPSGFPNNYLLKGVWMSLNSDYQLMCADTVKLAKTVDRAHEMADACRLCTKHLVDLKRARTPFLTCRLQELVDMVADEPSSSPTQAQPMRMQVDPFATPRETAVLRAEPTTLQEEPPVATRNLRAEPSDVSMVSILSSEPSFALCSATCNCQKCRKEAIPMSCSGSATSRVAAKETGHVPEGRGQHTNMVKIMKRPSAILKRPSSADPRFKIERRHTPGKREAYIMQDGRFVVTCSETKKGPRRLR